MSRAIPKSPILATRPGPLQVSRQLRAAMSLIDEKNTQTVRSLHVLLEMNVISYVIFDIWGYLVQKS